MGHLARKVIGTVALAAALALTAGCIHVHTDADGNVKSVELKVPEAKAQVKAPAADGAKLDPAVKPAAATVPAPAFTLPSFAKLTGRNDAEAQGIGVMLLADIRQVWREMSSERIFSKALVERLRAMTDRPWPEANRGKSISETWLARRLRPFDVHSRDLRIGEDHAKGYEAADFAEAFERYLKSGLGRALARKGLW